MHKLVHTRLDLSYPDLTRLRGGRDGSNKFDRPPATGTATPGSSGQGRPDGPPRPGSPVARPGGTPHCPRLSVRGNPGSGLLLGPAVEAGGGTTPGPKGEGGGPPGAS